MNFKLGGKKGIMNKYGQEGKDEDKKDKRLQSSPSYKLAFQDPDFLLRDELHSMRIYLEMIKPEIILQEQDIKSTVVIFGSSRIPEPHIAKMQLKDLERQVRSNPHDRNLQRKLRTARRQLENSRYYNEARKLARLISENSEDRHLVICTGGGPGIMQAANQGAMEAGAKSIGLNIKLPHEQVPNQYITPELCFQFHYFAVRKMFFLMYARALIVFPGGFGTLDELFETLALLQARKIESLLVILFDADYWKKLIDFDLLVQDGSIDQEDLQLFHYAETAEEAWELISGINTQETGRRN